MGEGSCSAGPALLRRSIPTSYGGILFRSKVEVDWALIFDQLGVQWQYEPRGHYFGGQFYLPDFWLPRSLQYVEVKAVWEPADVRKAFALVAHARPRILTGPDCPDLPLIAAMPGGVFYGFRARPAPTDFADGLLNSCRWTTRFRCAVCRSWWFADR